MTTVMNESGIRAEVLYVDQITRFGFARIDGATIPCRIDMNDWRPVAGTENTWVRDLWSGLHDDEDV